MSFDLNLITRCDHRVYKELTALEDDFRSIRLEKPIGSTDNIRVYAMDNLLSPSLYDIVPDPEQIDVNRDRIIKLKDEWRSPRDYFEITYLTLSSFCAKCSGSNTLDDISYNVRGGLYTIRDEALLMQNIEKFVITTINSNPFHQFIGTGLVGLIGNKIANTSFLVSQITSEITRTLQKLQDLQAQYQMTGRAITPGEMLESVNDIQVTSDEEDPTILRATISVTAQSGKPVQFTQILRLR